MKLHRNRLFISELIQENGKLNTKILPETTEKKPQWKFWKT
jgi:hypothetical protein